MIHVRFVLGALIFIGLSCSNSRGERVGFSFAGALQVGTSGTTTLFGITVPKNAPLNGTFSYDTTTNGVDSEPGVRTFHQYISGGYTLNIYNGAIQLAANDYVITVGNNYGSPSSDLFSVDYNYDSANGVTPERILVNGTAWTGSRSFIKVALSWDPGTFQGPDEPKLTADRPQTPNPGVTAFVGSSGSPRIFSVTSISAIVPSTGDYNRDGKVDTSDYAEWRKAFNETQPQFLYADGNNDGVVDAADYVVSRKASLTGLDHARVPEPCTLTLAVIGSLLFLFVGRAKLWHRGER